ncbi:MAG: hypothetical protein HY023_16430 [Chloroflexi bacterium]|nr:hypothetical protein [Chloroflexota bacterium]
MTHASLRPMPLIFALLVAIYGLSYSGTFTADDEHLFISGAQSLARTGRLEANQVYGNSRFQGIFRDVEPGQALVGSLLVRQADKYELGRTQTPFLMNMFATALTACFVYLAVMALGYRNAVAVLAGILYGTATMAWPYAKTYFRDPLAALMLAGASWGCELALAQSRSRTVRLIGWGAMAGFLVGGMLAKSTVAVAIPILPAVALLRSWRGRVDWRTLRAPLAVALIFVAGALIVSRLIPSRGAFGRFSWDYFAFLLDFFLHAPRQAFFEALLGPILSPGKSIFLYSPILILAVVSTAIAWRKRWHESLAAWLILAALILAQALFYDDDWWGHTNWGLRYLLPALPLLTVACAPALDATLSTRSTALHVTTWGLIGLSVLAQVGGVAANARVYVAAIDRLGPDAVRQLAIWQPRYSAILGHWQMLANGAKPEIAWVRAWHGNAPAVALVNAMWLIVAAVSVWGLRRPSIGLSAFSLVMALALPYPMLKAYYLLDPAHYGQRPAFRAAAEFMDREAAQGDVVLVQAYGQPLWHFYLNYNAGLVEWYSLPLHFPTREELDRATASGDTTATLAPSAVTLLRRLPIQYRRAWLINALDAVPGGLRLEEKWLAAHYSLLGEWIIADHEGQVRVSLFSLPEPPQVLNKAQVANASLSARIRLSCVTGLGRYAVAPAAMPSSTSSGNDLAETMIMGMCYSLGSRRT